MTSILFIMDKNKRNKRTCIQYSSTSLIRDTLALSPVKIATKTERRQIRILPSRDPYRAPPRRDAESLGHVTRVARRRGETRNHSVTWPASRAVAARHGITQSRDRAGDSNRSRGRRALSPAFRAIGYRTRALLSQSSRSRRIERIASKHHVQQTRVQSR